MSESESIEASPRPSTVESIRAALHTLGVESGQTLLVHSSLSALGFVSGGAQAVIEALIETVGNQGTVVVPTHSAALSDPANWGNPPVPEAWWEEIRETMPAYDPHATPTRAMGVIPELFRRLPDVQRGEHPASSFAARGPLAETIVAEQSLEDPFGEDSPLSRLYELEASVLLLGVGYDSCTSLHLAERRAQGSHAKRLRTGAPVRESGVRIWKAYEEFEVSSDDFARLGAEFETETKAVSVARVGQGETRRVPVRPLVLFATDWIQQHRL